jgi:hypothetical protein
VWPATCSGVFVICCCVAQRTHFLEHFIIMHADQQPSWHNCPAGALAATAAAAG